MRSQIARVLGELAVRIAQPALTGELLAVVLMGILVTHQSPATFATPIGLKWIYGKGRRYAS